MYWGQWTQFSFFLPYLKLNIKYLSIVINESSIKCKTKCLTGKCMMDKPKDRQTDRQTGKHTHIQKHGLHGLSFISFDSTGS